MQARGSGDEGYGQGAAHPRTASLQHMLVNFDSTSAPSAAPAPFVEALGNKALLPWSPPDPSRCAQAAEAMLVAAAQAPPHAAQQGISWRGSGSRMVLGVIIYVGASMQIRRTP
jgi:hypothetical protein